MKFEVAEWIGKQISAEKKRKYYDVDVYAVLRITEKAVEVVFASDSNGIYTGWCPKSQIIMKNDEGEIVKDNLDEELTKIQYRTYQEVCNAFNDEMSSYR